MSKLSAALLVVIVALPLICAGCGPKFTRQTYETVYVGQPAAEVEAIMGKPAAKFSDSWTYLHEDPFYKAIIGFESGRVRSKSWYDSNQMGDHPDTLRPAGAPNATDNAGRKINLNGK